MLAAQRRLRGFHESLRIGRTSLTDEHGFQLEEDGVFAADNGVPIAPATFLGFYTGIWSEATSSYRGHSRHILEVGGWRIKPRLGVEAYSRGLDIISRVNEPKKGRRANCAFVAFVNERELLSQGDAQRRIAAVLRECIPRKPAWRR